MENGIIHISDALKIMQLKDREGKPFPFDMTYRTFNSQTKKGGRLKHFISAKYLPEANPNSKPSLHPDAVFAEEKPTRNPSHFQNRTRNIELSTGEVKKLRFDFMISINNKKIIY